MKKLFAMLSIFGLCSVLSFSGHCTSEKPATLKSEYSVANLNVVTSVAFTKAPAVQFSNLIVVADQTPEVRALMVSSGGVMLKSPGLFLPFERRGSELWRSKQGYTIYKLTHNSKAVPKNQDQGNYGRAFNRKGMNRTFGNLLRFTIRPGLRC